MSFKEDLMGALKTTVDHYNNGMTPEEAIVKSAKVNNFNKDQTDRLVEAFNTARTINFFKRAEDRTGSFDIADKDKVVSLMLSGSKAEKKASSFDYSFYSGDVKNLSKRPVSSRSLEKAAPASCTNTAEGLSMDTLSRKALETVRMCKQSADSARDTAGAIHSELISQLYKLAESLRSGYDRENRYAIFKEACEEYPVTKKNLEKIMPSSMTSFLKKASIRTEVLDTSTVENEIKLASYIEEMYTKRKELLKEASLWDKKAEEIYNSFTKAAGIRTGKETKTAASLLLKVAQNKPGGDKGGNRQSPLNLGSVKELSGFLSNPLGISSMEMRGVTPFAPNIRDMAKEKKDMSSQLANLRRSAILTELLMTDPILSEADPQQVAENYKSIVSIAPHVSTNKEIVRSILRQSSNSVAISPYDADTWAKLDVDVQEANGLIKKHKPDGKEEQ